MTSLNFSRSETGLEIRRRVTAKRVCGETQDQTKELLDRVSGPHQTLETCIAELYRIGSHHTLSIWKCDDSQGGDERLNWRNWAREV
jgi:hypothetical protein